jgi:hypothetical protein
MSPWDLLGWVVAVSVSLIVAAVTVVVVIAASKTLRRGTSRRKTIDG